MSHSDLAHRVANVRLADNDPSPFLRGAWEHATRSALQGTPIHHEATYPIVLAGAAPSPEAIQAMAGRASPPEVRVVQRVDLSNQVVDNNVRVCYVSFDERERIQHHYEVSKGMKDNDYRKIFDHGKYRYAWKILGPKQAVRH